MLGILFLPFYLKDRSKKNEVQQNEIENIEKRTEKIFAIVTELVKNTKYGEDFYCVVCEHWSGSETFRFRSIPSKYELNLTVGQEIEVMVEPGNLSNYYVMINEYIKIAKLDEEVKFGTMSILPEHMKNLPKEKKYFLIKIFVVLALILMIIIFLLFQGIVTKTQVRLMTLLICVVVLIIRKRVEW